MVNLVIDFGNTRTKAAIFEDNRIIFQQDNFSLQSLDTLKRKYTPGYTIASSVSLTADEVRKSLSADALVLSHDTPLPFTIKYKTPNTLGLDRIAAVAGAQFLHPDQNCLVIDAGTCITYDIIDKKSNYLGGGISPGINMRFKALNTFTANLPLVNYSEKTPLVGQTTKESIESGVIHGVIGEIREIIRMYTDKFANLRIITCGGDAKTFEKELKAGIFATPELVLTGLNRILLYNVQNKS